MRIRLDTERQAKAGVNGAGAIGADDEILFAIPDVEGVLKAVALEDVILDEEPFEVARLDAEDRERLA